MITIYDLLEVEEDASKEDIEKAYSRLVLEYRQDIKFDDKKNKENEMIVNRLKLAYEILTDDTKRKRYDHELAQKRAESLIENLSTKQEEATSSEKEEINNSTEIEENKEVNTIENRQGENKKQSFQKIEKQELSMEDDVLTKNEKNQIRKAAEKEFKQKLKKAKQAEEEYNEAYQRAYNEYLRKNGYAVKQPWTLKRIKRVIIAILIVIAFCFIMWHIPPIKRILIGLYEENFIIRALVNIVKAIINAIIK